MSVDFDALVGDLTAIRNRLETVTGYRRLTVSQREAVEDVRTRAQIALDRIAAAQQPVPDPVPEPEPEPEPTPPTTPVDDYPPPPRSRTVVAAPNGTTVEEDTHYVDPQGALVWSDGIAHVTVTGARSLPTIINGWQDVHVEGTPDRPILFPGRHDGRDALQVKGSNGGPQPEDVTIKHWRVENIDRRDNPDGHPDGLQLMSGQRIAFIDCVMVNVAVQPWFVKREGPSAGGGLIADILFLRCGSDSQGAEGYYSFHLDHSPTSSLEAARNVRLVDCYGDRRYEMDALVAANGGEVTGWRTI